MSKKTKNTLYLRSEHITAALETIIESKKGSVKNCIKIKKKKLIWHYNIKNYSLYTFVTLQEIQDEINKH